MLLFFLPIVYHSLKPPEAARCWVPALAEPEGALPPRTPPAFKHQLRDPTADSRGSPVPAAPGVLSPALRGLRCYRDSGLYLLWACGFPPTGQGRTGGKRGLPPASPSPSSGLTGLLHLPQPPDPPPRTATPNPSFPNHRPHAPDRHLFPGTPSQLLLCPLRPSSTQQPLPPSPP